MAWLTAADSVNQIIDNSQTIIKRITYYGGWLPDLEQTITIVSKRWPGVAIASAAAITATKAGEANVIDAHYTENGDGSATIFQTTETKSAWS